MTTHGDGITPHGDEQLLDDADLIVVPGTHQPGPLHEGRLDDVVRAALAWTASRCSARFDLYRSVRPGCRRRTRRRRDPDPGRLSAGVDLCLHSIRAAHGAEVANRAVRYLVLPAWRDGGQAQFIDAPLPQVAEESTSAAPDVG
jgi:hypothetical protein